MTQNPNDQHPNDQWGQQPAQWQPQDQQPQQPYGAYPQAALAVDSPKARNDLIKAVAVGGGLIVFTIVMSIFFDRLFYVLPIFGVVMIIQGVVKFLKARKELPQNRAVEAWQGQQQAYYQAQQDPYQAQQGSYQPQQGYQAPQPAQGYQPGPSRLPEPTGPPAAPTELPDSPGSSESPGPPESPDATVELITAPRTT